MTRRKKNFIAIALLVLGCFYLYKHHTKNFSSVMDATVVDIQTVKQGDIAQDVQAVGSLVAAQNVKIAPEIPGQVAKILFQDGTFVKQGTALIQLNDAVYKSKLDSAQADLNLSRTTYNRLAILAKKGVISQQDLEKAAADLKEKQASADESQVMVDKMLLTAPFDGVVSKVLVSLGDYVSPGQELVTLTDTHHLHVEYNIPEKYFGLLKLGQEITVTTSELTGKTFKGKVAYIAPTINLQDRTLSVYAEVPNDDQALVPGLFVTVQHSLGTAKHVLLVPATSLVASIDGHQVYKVVDGKAQTVGVEIGQRTLDSVEIVKGLVAGDEIVVAGQQKIREGAEVKASS